MPWFRYVFNWVYCRKYLLILMNTYQTLFVLELSKYMLSDCNILYCIYCIWFISQVHWIWSFGAISYEHTGIILYMRSANERWRYTVTPSLIGWAHTQNDPWHNASDCNHHSCVCWADCLCTQHSKINGKISGTKFNMTWKEVGIHHLDFDEEGAEICSV